MSYLLLLRFGTTGRSHLPRVYFFQISTQKMSPGRGTRRLQKKDKQSFLAAEEEVSAPGAQRGGKETEHKQTQREEQDKRKGTVFRY